VILVLLLILMLIQGEATKDIDNWIMAIPMIFACRGEEVVGLH
jgi:hypothetical protein